MMRDPADIVFVDGKVITCDRRGSVATGVAIKGDRISAIGRAEEIRCRIAADTKVIDLRGRAVIPGLIDTHAHMDREGLKLSLPSLAGATSVDGILERISALVATARSGEWIVTMPPGDPPYFRGFTGERGEDRLPNRWELDSVAPGNPVFIRPPWGYWNKTLPLQSAANSLALQIAGINGATAFPWDGLEIEKDPRTGEPTGIFREHTMMPTLELLLASIPRFSLSDRVSALRVSQQLYHSCGTTSIFEGHGVAPEVIRAYQELADSGELTMRSALVFSPPWKPGTPSVRTILNDWLPWLAAHGIGDAMLRICGLYTAAGTPPGHELRVQAGPYTGWAGFCYQSVVTRTEAREIVLEAARAGIRIATTFTDLLDVFEEADRISPIGAQRWVMAHVDRLSLDEMRRLRDLGIVVTLHPNRSIAAIGAKLARELGPNRASEIMPLRAMLEIGARFALSSDNVPVSLFHPLAHCVTRRHRSTGERIAPEQSLTRQEALNAATIGGAYVTFEEDRKGSIETGKLADLAVLSDDPLTVEEGRLKEIVSEMTMVGGHVVFQRAPTFGAEPRQDAD